MRALFSLLAKSIDYAGLFPPAKLDMQAAVENYAAYVASQESWMLGRFIVPVGRLGEFEEAAYGMLPGPRRTPWHLSVLCHDLSTELPAVKNFNEQHAQPSSREQAVIDALELKSFAAEKILKDRDFDYPVTRYYEIPVDRDPSALIAAIAQIKSCAKIRTGGISEDAFPRPEEVIRFLALCIRNRVSYKATAGLHHPIRGMYKLTYEQGSSSAMMFGFLNLFLAGALLASGMSEDQAVLALEEKAPDAFRFEEDAITWRGYRLEREDLRRTRQLNAVSFGSCSFLDPVEELKEMGILPDN